MSPNAIGTLIQKIIPLADVLTPNIPEVEKIADIKIDSSDDMEKAAMMIYDMGCRNVLIKGGHAEDILYDGKEFYHYKTCRINTKNTHGTGCTLSSAIDKENIGKLSGTGIDGIALVSAIFASVDIEGECRELRELSDAMVGNWR